MSAELRDVPGPSSLGGGRRRALELLWTIAVAEFRRTYLNTALGYVWSVLRPLALFAVLLVVFTQVFRLGSEVPNYPVLLLMNIVLMGFFQEATTAAVTSIVAQESVLRKAQFPRLVVPLATVLTALMTLGLNLVVVAIFLVAFGVTPTATWLLLPLVLVGLLVLTVATAMLLAALYPRFRDVLIIWTVASTTLFYASPVLYPLERAPEALRTLLIVNPFTPLLHLARTWVIDPTAPGLREVAGGTLPLAAPALVAVAVVGLGVWTFRREAPRVAEAL